VSRRPTARLEMWPSGHDGGTCLRSGCRSGVRDRDLETVRASMVAWTIRDLLRRRLAGRRADGRV